MMLVLTIQLFQSYLYGRTQCAKVDGVLFSPVSVTSCFTQGSGLGPFLFILFTIYLPDAIGNSLYYLYSDDLKTLSTGSIQCIQTDIDSLSQWSRKMVSFFILSGEKSCLLEKQIAIHCC